MLTYNLDVEAGFCNGSRGVIIRFSETRPKVPEVRFVNGMELLIQHQIWDLKVGHGTKITRTQLPLALGFASTIHKCQGSSLDVVEVDLGKTIFAPGQFYTALSRVRNLEGLCITDLSFDGVRIHAQAEEYYDELEKLSLKGLKKTLFLCLRRYGIPRGPAMIACSYVVPLYT
jgi:ATP-dependent DNA helicase PIF1